MPNNWKKYKLGELGDIKGGKRLPKGEALITTKTKHPYIRVTDMGTRTIPIEKLQYVPNDVFPKISRYIVNKNDLILSIVGTVGSVSIIDEKLDNASLTENCVKITNLKNIDSEYLYYFLISDIGQFEIVKGIVGSTQPKLPIYNINNLDISLPSSIQEQKSIASILSAIDDKIENNLSINKTLEEMAMALYKHWFVDFGPFQDGEFVESELGRIPKGWEVKRLENFVEVLSKGTTPRMKDVEGLERKIPFLKVKDINSDGEININGLELIPEETHLKDLKRSILLENDLLFSIAGTIGRVSIVTEKLNNSNCNQALAFIRLKEREKFKAIIYYWLKSDDVQNKIQNSIVQGVQANVSLTVLKELELIEPSNEILIDFANKVNPILELVLKNQKENQTLTQLRDTLLPKLISGEVRLKEFRN
ncbi:restriction endonuclease subunit S [Flavobacterium lacisediminis]|uniref:Restriction endonuclease subunit S n=1 Tax=Flavobacterium lacisediminis TaxID=2989705 RepID=A0ABT3EKK0_9FLAO|nr:restriction endonuclease subunit S [Flavobacterium lacisediminis]MCW1149108.1 restriction endonuclease subunit S [Flavobacterium lacisediminis]